MRARTGSDPATVAAEAADRALGRRRAARGSDARDGAASASSALVLVAAGRDADAERWLRYERARRAKRRRRAVRWARRARPRPRALLPRRARAAQALGVKCARACAARLGLRPHGRDRHLLAMLVESGRSSRPTSCSPTMGPIPRRCPGSPAPRRCCAAAWRCAALSGAMRRRCADADDLLARLERRGHTAPGPLGEAAPSLPRGRRARAGAGARRRGARAGAALGHAERDRIAARRLLGDVTGGEAGRRELEQAVVDARGDAVPARARQGAAGARRRATAGQPACRRARAAAAGARPRGALRRRAARRGGRVSSCARAARGRAALLLTGPDSLTASERRVAELAARGLSNPDVARTLVVSRSTVESHLRAVYRKLDVSARSELSAALAKTSPSLPDAKPVGARADSRP